MRVESDFRRQTHRLEREERDQYGNFLWNLLRFEKKPQVTMLEIVGARMDNPVEYFHEDSLNTTVDYYHQKIDRMQLIRVLKYYTVYLMQQARTQPDLDKQLFLIFKAVEFARMVVQYSSYAVNTDAEALVFGVFHDLGEQGGSRFRRYVEREQTIYSLMKRLQVSPVDNDARLEMADMMVRQTCYTDAMVQYGYLLGRYPRVPPEADLPRARVHVRIAEMFQELIDFASERSEEFRDARKLKNFIDRYNRDFADKKRKIVRLESSTGQNLQRSIQSMRGVANSWYQRALQVRLLGPRMVTKLVTSLANNFMKDRHNKQALQTLTNGYKFWRQIPDSIETIENRVEYLNFMAQVGAQLRHKDTMEFAARELREFQNRLTELIQRRDAEDMREQMMFEGERVTG